MPPRSRKRRVLRIVAWSAGVIFGLVVIAAIAGWFAFQRVPSWYEARHYARRDLPHIRNSLPNTYQDLNERIVAGEVFEYAFDANTITDWIVARAELYPDAAEWIPDWIRDPVVAFEDNRAIIGARIDYDGWQAIIGIHLVADITREHVTVRVDKLTAGALPIPMDMLAEPLQQLLDSSRIDPESLPDPIRGVVARLQSAGPQTLVDQGVQWRNIFETDTAGRWIKFKEARAADGKLYVTIEPR